ncbi:MAG: sulfotransferase [Cyanobacteria bacterium P01_G01_bin.38]
MGINNFLPLKKKTKNFLISRKFNRPVFIISPPRAGSTFLFDCLRRFEEFVSLNVEADKIWWSFLPYEKMAYPCDFIAFEPGKRNLYSAIDETCQKEAYFLFEKSLDSNARKWLSLASLKGKRYLDKTIANCFRLDVLNALHPDATYLFLVRDPRANISSMLEGWNHCELMGKPQLTPLLSNITPRTIDHWSYPAPPQWQAIISKPLEYICAWSWCQHVEHILDFFDKTRSNCFFVRYEDLFEDTVATIADIARTLNIRLNQSVLDYLNSPSLSRTTISKPGHDKWKHKNYDQILSILPVIGETAARIGYDVSIGLQPGELL